MNVESKTTDHEHDTQGPAGPEGATDEGVRVDPFDEHNRALVHNVHPLAWPNPEPHGRYNLVVIGGGPAGLVCAAGAAGLGARVALIERHLLGGDCLNVGCVPSKALLRAARAVQDVRDAGRFGVEVEGEPRVDFGKVMERMRRLRAGLSHHDSAARFRDLGIDVFLGSARFTGPDTVAVGDHTLRFKKAVVATGARASVPPIPGLEDAGYLTNETVFSLTELPPRLAVIGAGPIGCELAQAFRRFGSEVTLLDIAPQILIREDRDAARRVEEALERDGVRSITNAKIGGLTRGPGGVRFQLTREGEPVDLEVDAVLVGAGRKPNVDNLGLEEAGIRFDPRKGIEVDGRLRTSNSRVYAAGDVCSKYQFTHTADAMARMVIRNALFMGRAKVSDLIIPWCTYTDPEIAHVGLYEHEAREQGIEVTTFTHEMKDLDRAVLDGEEDGFVKIHVRAGTDTIIGATIVARHAGEMIGEVCVAMRAGVGLGTIADTIHPYPTQAEAIKRAADAYNRTRLTPFAKGVLTRWLSWTR